MSDSALEIAAEIIKERLAQQEQQNMIVYFTKEGTIKCISPIEDESMEATLQKTIMPLSKVKRFIDGTANINLFFVKQKPGKITEFDIIEKTSSIGYVKKLDRSLTKVEFKDNVEWELKIEWNSFKNTVTFILHDRIVSEFNERIHDITNADINGYRVLHFHLTAPDRPELLVETLSVKVSELISHQPEFKIEHDVSELSLYTKKIFKKYSYKEVT